MTKYTCYDDMFVLNSQGKQCQA